MTRYKLTYFKYKARAESIRILLSFAGADWEDIRLPSIEDFRADMKQSGVCPYGSLPILEVDGVVIGQSMAILRYLAKELGLVPKTNLQVAIADGIVDQIQDLCERLVVMAFEEDLAKKEHQKKDLYENIIPQTLKFLENILKENSQEDTFFFGNKITYADIHFFNFTNNCVANGKLEVPDMVKQFPGLATLYEAVMNEPKVLAYLNKRPSTLY